MPKRLRSGLESGAGPGMVYPSYHAHPFRPSTQRATPHRQLLWHDGGRLEAPARGRGLLLHRRLPLAHQYPGRQAAALARARPRHRLPRLRVGSGQVRAVPPERRARAHRAGLDPQHRHPHGPARALPQLQGQDRQWHQPLARPLRLPGPHGRRHPHLRQRRRARWQGPEAARRGHPRHRRQDEPGLWRGPAQGARTAHSRGDRRRARPRRPQDEQELRQHHPAL